MLAMGGDPAVIVEDVWKRFKLHHDPVLGPIKERLLFWRADRYYQALEAVQAATFTLERGRVLGIVGPNGAGKSTLLKCLAGLLVADRGEIEVRGRVTALLAHGVGVHQEFTGRENAYFGGLLLGMSKREVKAKLPWILDFSEIGDFADRPLRTYSSGMRARLLFSISMSIDPEVLIVDEALATGDASFVRKCAGRIREICSQGATVIFVSHNLAHVLELCHRALFMAQGRILHDGSPSSAIAAYNQWIFDSEASRHAGLPAGALTPIGGTREVLLTSVRLLDGAGAPQTGFFSGERMVVEVGYRSRLAAGSRVDVFLGLLRDPGGEYVGESNTVYTLKPGAEGPVRERVELRAEQGVLRFHFDPLLLLNGHYSLWLILYDGSVYHCEYRGLAPFFVARRGNTTMRDAVFWQPCRVEQG